MKSVNLHEGIDSTLLILQNQHQGKLECLSFPGKGTEFRIVIPVKKPALTAVCESHQREVVEAEQKFSRVDALSM